MSTEQRLRHKAERIVGKRKRFAEIVGEAALPDTLTERELGYTPSEPLASAIQSDTLIGTQALSPRLPVGGVVAAPIASTKAPRDSSLVQTSGSFRVTAPDVDATSESQFWLATTPTSDFKRCVHRKPFFATT